MQDIILYPGNDKEQAIGRDSCCVLVREASVGVSGVSLGSFLLNLIPPPQSYGENDVPTGAAGKGSCSGNRKFIQLCWSTLVLV